MHPLHNYVAKQVAERLKAKHVVVWYDPREEFGLFVEEITGVANGGKALITCTIDGIETNIAYYNASYFELRLLVEPIVCSDTPQFLVVYIPGQDRDRHGSVIMELELAGECYEPQLKRLARSVLRQQYTDGVIDEMLAPEHITYEDLARASAETTSDEPPSILKAIFHNVYGGEAILACWLAQDKRDLDIEAKEATKELIKLVRSRLGLELTNGASITKLRAITMRYVLVGEFRADLNCCEPACLDSVPSPPREKLDKVKGLTQLLRNVYPDELTQLADQVESELGLRNAKIPSEALGSVDIFRFEEQTILGYTFELIATHNFALAYDMVQRREQSFWLKRDIRRKAQWEACRMMAELGVIAVAVRKEIETIGSDPNKWVEVYAANDGWYRLDQAQRRLEAWVITLEEEPEEHSLAVVRRLYEDVCQLMAEGFTKTLLRQNWIGVSSLLQNNFFSEFATGRPKPYAYFVVDALRFEMGMELAERFPETAEVSIRHAFGVLPGITTVGMAALLPGATSSFTVVEQDGKLGARIDDTFLPDLPARKKFAAARIPGLFDLTLDDLLSLPLSKLSKKLQGSQVILVRSQEIDIAGEMGTTFQARQVMDNVIDNLARAVKKLAAVGIENVLLTADHGHLFFAVDRDESMRTDSPGGQQIELHRRCWVGRGGTTPPGCVRVEATQLGYESDLDFVFPTGCGVFRAGGDLAYHHGGLSLQELIIPVLTVRLKTSESPHAATSSLTVNGIPEAVTNRIFSITLQQGGSNLTMFAEKVAVRPLLMAGGKQVGMVGMAIDAEFDRMTGCIILEPNKAVTVAFMLSDDSAPSLRIVIQDPSTDAELYRTPVDIPVRLGV